MASDGPPAPPPPVLAPMGLPHFGDDLTLADFVEGMGKLVEKSNAAGKSVGYYTEMGFEWLLVNDANLGTELLQQNTQHNLWPGLVAASSAFFGPKVLFILEGEEWMSMRRILRGEMLETQLSNFADDMGACARHMAQQVNKVVGKEVDAYTLVTAYHLDAASKSLYGDTYINSINTFPNRSDLVKSYIWFTSELPRRAFAFTDPSLNVDYETDNEDNRLMKEMSHIAHSEIKSVVQKRLVTRAEDRKNKKPDMLELLFQAYDKEYGEGQSADKIMEGLGANLVELLFAGFNTVSGVMTNAIYKLSQEPEIVRKIRAEVDSILAGQDRPFNFDDFEKLKYTQLCFYETVRIYPPSPVMARMLGPSQTELDDIKIPAGVQAMVPLGSLGVDSRYWKDPLRMWPERPEWHDDKGNFLPNSRTRGAFMPFSDGPRNCVGKYFARMEYTMLIATLFHKFDFVPAPGYEHGTSFNGFGFHPCNKNTQERVVRMIVKPRAEVATGKL